MVIFLASIVCQRFREFWELQDENKNGLENSVDYICKTRVIRTEENILHEYLRGKLILRFALPHSENLIL